jgi:integrase
LRRNDDVRIALAAVQGPEARRCVVRVRDLFAQWPAAAPSLAQRTEETIVRTAEMAAPFARAFGGRELESLQVLEVAAWASKHPARARYARVILADAVTMGLLPASPFTGVRVRRPEGRGSYFPSTEEILALAAAGERYGLGAFTMTAAFSGGRLSALAELSRPYVDRGPTDGTLLLKLRCKPVSRGYYQALLLEEGVAVLEEYMRGPGRVFKTARGFRWDRKSVSRCWVLMRREVGLPESCTFHATRRHYATLLLNRGKSMMDVAFALDHVDADGRPNIDLVQRIYGRPDRSLALERLADARAA